MNKNNGENYQTKNTNGEKKGKNNSNNNNNDNNNNNGNNKKEAKVVRLRQLSIGHDSFIEKTVSQTFWFP